MVGSGFAIRGFARFCCMVGDRIFFGAAWLIADGCVGGRAGRWRGVRYHSMSFSFTSLFFKLRAELN